MSDFASLTVALSALTDFNEIARAIRKPVNLKTVRAHLQRFSDPRVDSIACVRVFLSHFLITTCANEVLGERPCAERDAVTDSCQDLHAHMLDADQFLAKLTRFQAALEAWKSIDIQHMAHAYQETYSLLRCMEASTPDHSDKAVVLDSIAHLRRILDGQTRTLFSSQQVEQIQNAPLQVHGSDRVEAQVEETVRTAFWDRVVEHIEQDDYSDVGPILERIRECLQAVLVNEKKREEIGAVLDVPFLLQQLEHGAMHCDQLARLFAFCLEWLKRLGSPADDRVIHKWKQLLSEKFSKKCTTREHAIHVVFFLRSIVEQSEKIVQDVLTFSVEK